MGHEHAGLRQVYRSTESLPRQVQVRPTLPSALLSEHIYVQKLTVRGSEYSTHACTTAALTTLLPSSLLHLPLGMFGFGWLSANQLFEGVAAPLSPSPSPHYMLLFCLSGIGDILSIVTLILLFVGRESVKAEKPDKPDKKLPGDKKRKGLSDDNDSTEKRPLSKYLQNKMARALASQGPPQQQQQQQQHHPPTQMQSMQMHMHPHHPQHHSQPHPLGQHGHLSMMQHSSSSSHGPLQQQYPLSSQQQYLPQHSHPHLSHHPHSMSLPMQQHPHAHALPLQHAHQPHTHLLQHPQLRVGGLGMSSGGPLPPTQAPAPGQAQAPASNSSSTAGGSIFKAGGAQES